MILHSMHEAVACAVYPAAWRDEEKALPDLIMIDGGKRPQWKRGRPESDARTSISKQCR